MRVIQMVEVRNIQESDLEAAKSLTDAEEWGNSKSDWNRLFKKSIPIGAYDDGELVGVTTAFDFSTLGMIGNVIVSEDYRGKEIGRKLVIEAKKRLETCDSVRVHSNMNSTVFYKKLGFIPEGMSTLFRLDADLKEFQPFAIDSDDNTANVLGVNSPTITIRIVLITVATIVEVIEGFPPPIVDIARVVPTDATTTLNIFPSNKIVPKNCS